MKTLHFILGNYTTIKNERGKYSFLGTGKTEMIQHMEMLSDKVARIQREIEALTVYLDGESVSDPEALR